MAITQNYGLIWKGFSEEVTAEKSEFKSAKNVHECPSELLQDLGAVGYE